MKSLNESLILNASIDEGIPRGEVGGVKKKKKKVKKLKSLIDQEHAINERLS